MWSYPRNIGRQPSSLLTYTPEAEIYGCSDWSLCLRRLEK